MDSLSLVIGSPGGRVQQVWVPKDAPISNVLVDLVTLYDMPLRDSDGNLLEYQVINVKTGRPLDPINTLIESQVTQDDRLLLTTHVTAGGAITRSPRMRRLQADYDRMKELDARSSLIDIKAVGPAPPERYIVTFHIKSIVGVDRQGRPTMGNKHQVEIYLHNEYPQRWPGLKWLTPIWHPNINHVNGSVCIDAAWWGAARSLDRLVIMMGEMLQYKNFHDDPKKPPYPWDKEAAEWCRSYRIKNPGVFPTDERELMRPERIKLGGKSSQKTAPESSNRVKLGGGTKKRTSKVKIKG